MLNKQALEDLTQKYPIYLLLKKLLPPDSQWILLERLDTHPSPTLSLLHVQFTEMIPGGELFKLRSGWKFCDAISACLDSSVRQTGLHANHPDHLVYLTCQLCQLFRWVISSLGKPYACTKIRWVQISSFCAFYSVPWLALQLEAWCMRLAGEASWRTEVLLSEAIRANCKDVISGQAQRKPLVDTYMYKSLFGSET